MSIFNVPKWINMSFNKITCLKEINHCSYKSIESQRDFHQKKSSKAPLKSRFSKHLFLLIEFTHKLIFTLMFLLTVILIPSLGFTIKLILIFMLIFIFIVTPSGLHSSFHLYSYSYSLISYSYLHSYVHLDSAFKFIIILMVTLARTHTQTHTSWYSIISAFIFLHSIEFILKLVLKLIFIYSFKTQTWTHIQIYAQSSHTRGWLILTFVHIFAHLLTVSFGFSLTLILTFLLIYTLILILSPTRWFA